MEASFSLPPLNFFLFIAEHDFILDKKKTGRLKWGCLEKEKGVVLINT